MGNLPHRHALIRALATRLSRDSKDSTVPVVELITALIHADVSLVHLTEVTSARHVTKTV